MELGRRVWRAVVEWHGKRVENRKTDRREIGFRGGAGHLVETEDVRVTATCMVRIPALKGDPCLHYVWVEDSTEEESRWKLLGRMEAPQIVRLLGELGVEVPRHFTEYRPFEDPAPVLALR